MIKNLVDVNNRTFQISWTKHINLYDNMKRRQQNYWLPFTIYHIDQRNYFTNIIKIEQKIDNNNNNNLSYVMEAHMVILCFY